MGEIQSLTKYKEKTLEERKYTGTRLTKSKLLDMIGSKEDVSNFEQTQWALFKKFIILKRFGEDIADLEQVISIDSKGFGKNFAEAIALERASDELKASPKIGGTEELLNTGIPGRALGALRTSNVLWSNTHFYNSYQASNTLAFIKTHVTKKFNSINQEAEFDNTAYKAMKSFMMTDAGTGLFEENLDNVRQRLFKGSNSLVKRTMALKESDDVNISNNAFINSLDTKKAYNNIAEQVYQNITNINDSTSDRIILGLTDLILNEREVNGVNTRVFAEDLVKGAVLSGNLYGAVDYAKAISPAYLHALPFMNRLATLNSDTLDEVGYFFAEANLDLLNSESPALWPPFILQFFRNHPETILNTNYKKAGKSFTYYTKDTFAPAIFSTFGASNARGRSPYRVFIKTKKEGKTTYYVDIKALNGTFFKQYDANREGSSKLQDSMVNGELTEGIIDELTKIEDLTANKKEALYNSHSKTVSTSQEYRNKLLKSKGNTILTTIVENTNNPLFNQIASILNKLDLGGVSLVIDKNMSQPGKKRGSTVYINPNKLSSVFDMERVVLHEVLHIVTSMNSNEKFKSNMNALFEEAVKSYKKKLSKNELEVFEKAQMLFNKAKKTQKTEDFEEFSKYMSDNNIKHLYGFLSSSEFTSEIFTQPEFQDELNKLSIKGKKGLEAILDKIAEFILNTFKTVTGQKVNKDSALYAGIYNLLKLDTSETIEETQQEETNQPSEEKGMFNDDGDYIVESEEELALEYNRPVDKQLSNLTNVGEAVESSIFDNIAPSKIDLFKSANMIKSDGSVKEFKTSERTLNQLQSKARSIRDAQISEYGIEFYKVEISNNSKNGTSYSTLKLNPVVKDLNSPLEMANLVTDKMIREYQKICR